MKPMTIVLLKKMATHCQRQHRRNGLMLSTGHSTSLGSKVCSFMNQRSFSTWKTVCWFLWSQSSPMGLLSILWYCAPDTQLGACPNAFLSRTSRTVKSIIIPQLFYTREKLNTIHPVKLTKPCANCRIPLFGDMRCNNRNKVVINVIYSRSICAWYGYAVIHSLSYDTHANRSSCLESQHSKPFH